MSIAAQFITFEGGEGAGKSTQLRLLASTFAAAGIACLATREPGGCASAEEIRHLLVNGAPDRWHPQTEALLMMAARSEHCNHTIQPALKRGEWVLCDRFFDSTLVYQGHGKGLGESWLSMLNSLLFGQFAPALTLYFDIEPSVGLARTQTRAGGEGRFEAMPLSFHQQVRKGFLALEQRFPQRIQRINAQATQQQVHCAVLEVIQQRYGLALPVASEVANGSA